MPSGTSTAVTEATRLNEIGFAEFTTKLVTDVFNALVGAQIHQMEAYSELLAATSKTLTDYLSDSSDQVSDLAIQDWLSANLPGPAASVTAPTIDDDTIVYENVKLDATEIGRVASRTGVPTTWATAGTSLTSTNVDAVTNKVRAMLATDRYNALKEMARMGLLRLVVTDGYIETRLTFTTYGSSDSLRAASSASGKTSSISGTAKTGKALNKWVDASVTASHTSVSARTTSAIDRDVSGSSVQIYGAVRVNFKTDYQPLAPAPTPPSP
jgi:hypothetical protein